MLANLDMERISSERGFFEQFCTIARTSHCWTIWEGSILSSLQGLCDPISSQGCVFMSAWLSNDLRIVHPV
ncbi:hypothetical protein NXS19_013580 [Fusarium pseudograminearum]|nr:hypothetical protein NXS19_013580 [Fusarium pseudograminearum]